MPHEQQEHELAEHQHSAGLVHMEDATNTEFHPGKPTKVLISPGEGAGWVTYAPRGSSDNFLIWMLTYEPMIKGLERREHKDKLEDILREFHAQAHQKFNVERLMVARVGDLVVQEVNGPFEVHENEGREKVVDVSRRRVIAMGANVL